MKYVCPNIQSAFQEEQKTVEQQLEASFFRMDRRYGKNHRSGENRSWGDVAKPIRATVDGKVIACHLGSSYQTSVIQEQSTSYSRDFCLIQHELPMNDDGSGQAFTFYSLYMHLAPHCENHVTVHAGRRYRVIVTCQAYAVIEQTWQSMVLKKGALIEEADIPRECHDGVEYQAFQVIENPSGKHHIPPENLLLVWLATRWGSREVLPFYSSVVQTSPDWMVDSVVGRVTEPLGLAGFSEPEGKKAGQPIMTLPSGTRVCYRKTKQYGWFEIMGKRRLMAHCRFPDHDVHTLAGEIVSEGWVCIEPQYIQPLSRETIEMDRLQCFGPDSPFLIRAGETIGYRSHYSRENGEDLRISNVESAEHVAYFSQEKPPVNVYQRLLNQHSESGNRFKWVGDVDSDGQVGIDEKSAFFQHLIKLIHK